MRTAILVAVLCLMAMLGPTRAANPEPTGDWLKLHHEWQNFLQSYCQCEVPVSETCYCRPAPVMDVNEYLKVRRLAAKVFEFKECR